MSYRSTIARQPDSIAACLAAAQAETAKLDISAFAGNEIIVTGIGASFAAAQVIAGELVRNNCRATAVRSVDLIDGRSSAKAIIALSHRGRSIETVESLNAQPQATRIAITNDDTSPLAQTSQGHIRLANGSDATPSSTGYTGTLAAAAILVEKLTGAVSSHWQALPSIASTMLTSAQKKMPRLRQLFHERRAIDCVGACSSLGTADGASLLIREAARIPAGATDTRHYLHGPMEAMDSRTGVVIFGDAREVELARQLDQIGCPVLLVTSRQDVDDVSFRISTEAAVRLLSASQPVTS
jgi:glutamine---fructose-6-phosphate transaminase (isomerizing)